MTHARDNFITWLRNAHAMEEQAVTLLTAQARRIESYPDLKDRVLEHLEETRGHVAALTEMLEKFAVTTPTFKDMTAKLAATAQGVGGLLVSDEVIKTMTTAFAFEHTEIASYKVLIAAADELDEPEAVAVFEHILSEEEDMAEWLNDNIDSITRIFLMRDERDLQAKR